MLGKDGSPTRVVSCAELLSASNLVAYTLLTNRVHIGSEDICLIVTYNDAELAQTRSGRMDHTSWPFASQGCYLLTLQLGVLR